MLTKLEFIILREQLDDREPLFVLYRAARDYTKGTTLDMIIEAIVSLFNKGFIKAYIYDGGKIELERLTIAELSTHCARRPDKDLREYPLGVEYLFEPTIEGQIEYEKDIYDIYNTNEADGDGV